MLRVDPIKNVNSTLNQPIFRAGVQTNYGIQPPVNKNIVEDGLFTVFLGVIENLISPKVKDRAESIENGLEETQQKFDAIA